MDVKQAGAGGQERACDVNFVCINLLPLFQVQQQPEHRQRFSNETLQTIGGIVDGGVPKWFRQWKNKTKKPCF